MAVVVWAIRYYAAMLDILAKVQEDHDRDPTAAAAALRGIPPGAVSLDEMTRYTWLVNHVIGEKLGGWDEVRGIYRGRSDDLDRLPVPALRNLAAAAALCGDHDAAAVALASLRRAASLGESEAALVLEMAKIMYGMPAMAERVAATEFARLCGIAMGWKRATGADTLVAGMTNNVTSAWLEMPRTWSSPIVRDAMEMGARTSRHFWGKAGTWVQLERADYLVAMVMNRLGMHEDARSHALAAIATIEEAGGGQDVDLACLREELGLAEKGLGETVSTVNPEGGARCC